MSERTSVQVKCPHVIQKRPVGLTTEDEEFRSNHRHRMAVTTDGHGAIDRDASPLS